jgi:hypothetical protein
MNKKGIELGKAFTFQVVDYNVKTQEYTLRHPITQEYKVISKEQFNILYEEQKET